MNSRATLVRMILLIAAGWLLGISAFGQTQTFTSSGTFNVPAGVNKVTVEAWGGGGAGGGVNASNTQNRGGGGGAGGSYTKTTNVTVTPLGTVTVTIGAGGVGATAANGGAGGTTTFGSGSPVTAIGGSGGTLGQNTASSGAGAGITTGTNFNGGAGGTAPGDATNATAGGGGGGGAGSTGSGSAGSGSSAGAGGSGGGGAGAAGVATSGNGASAVALSGGGAGAFDLNTNTDRKGGDGFRGQVIVTWSQPTPAITVFGPSPTTGNPVFKVVFSTPINTGSFTGADVTLSGTATGTLAAAIAEIAPNDGTTFTITVSGMTATGTVVADIAAGKLQDTNGNDNLVSNAGTTINYTHDTTGPTVAITAQSTSPTNTSPVFKVVFNEPILVGSFIGTDVTLTGTAGATTATIAQIAPNDGTTFTITATGMTGVGTVIAEIAASKVTDIAATPNQNSASNLGTSITFDNVGPNVTVDQAVAQADPTTGTTINFTAVFSEAINPATFTAGDITNSGTAGGATIGTPTTADNITWNIPVTGLSSDGTVILTIAAAKVQDPAGNDNTASTFTDKTVTFDIAPTVTVNQAVAQSDPTNGATINFTAVFSKAIAPASFVAADVTVGGTATGSTAGTPTTSDNITWNIPITGMSATGTVIVSLAANKVLDPAGIGNIASTSTDNSVTYDITGPDVTINQAVAQSDPTNVSPINFTAVFTEAINPATFTAADITVGGTSASASAGSPTTSDNITWNIPVTATADGTVIVSLAAAKVTDVVGNNNTASTSTDNSVLYDTPLTVTLNQAVAQADPTNAATINFTAVFNKAITPASFIAGDVTITGTATGAVAGTPTTADNITWNIPVTGMSAAGTVIAALGAGVVTDPAGFSNQASTFTDKTVTYDNVPPSVTINQAVAQLDPTNGATINFTVVFSEAINPATFTAGDISISGTAIGAIAGTPTTADNITWNVPVTGMTTDGTVIAAIAAAAVTDVAGNNNTVSTSTDNTVTYDTTPPSVTVNQAVAQADPTNVTTVNFTVVFSEAIKPSTFIAGDLTKTGTATGGVVGTPTTSDNITWNVAVTGLTGSGTVILSLGANKITDPAGNNNTASTSTDNTVTFDNVPPTVTVNQAVAQADPTNASPINFTAVFSEAINPATFTAGDVTLTGTAAGSAVGAPTTSDNITWNIPVTGMSSTGTVIVSLGANKVTDLAGNNNTGSTFTDQTVTYDITPPAVTSIVIGPAAPLTGIGTTNGTSTSTVPFQVTFSESVSGLDPSDFILSNTGTVVGTIASVTGGPSVYTVTVNAISGNGTMRLDFVSNGSVIDVATNPTNTSFNAGGAGATYSIVLPEPTSHVTGLTAVPGADNFSIKLTWVGSAAGANRYLIRAKGQLDDDSNGTYVTVTDGTVVSNDLIFGDGNGDVNLSSAFFTFTFNTLLSGKTYDFEVIPAALSPLNSADNIDYLIDGSQPSVTATTTTASTGTLVAGTATPPTTISSLTTSFGVPYNFSFILKDDGLSPALDNARTRFSQIVITAGGSNTVTNWSDVIAEAQLTDITENNASPILTTNIGVNTITFSSIANGSNAIGALDDNEQKEYRLRIRLKNPLTGGAYQIIDNQAFDFQIKTADITSLVGLSQFSQIAAGQTVASGAGVNTVDVSATQITFNPAFGGVQPPAAALVLTNLSTTPVARAVDANGNTDKNFAATLNITTPGSLGLSQVTIPSDALAPNAGVYTFPATFQYQNSNGVANNGTLTLTNGITGTSNNVTVTFSNSTTLVAGANPEPVKYSSLLTSLIGFNVVNNMVFDFNVTDDNGAGGDGAPTRISGVVVTQGTGNDIVDWTQAINDALIYDGSTTFFGTVNPTNITFTGLPNLSPGNFGYVADNGTRNFRVYIRLKPSLGGSLPATIDNLNLVYEVLASNFTLDPVSSGIAPGENENSGSTNNAVDVITTQMAFTNIIGSPTLVSKDISIQQSVPVVQAMDANGNRDLDYNSTTISVVDNGGRTMLNAPGASSLNAGLLTFANNFQFTSVGPANTLTVSSTTPNAAAGIPSAATSPAFVVQAGSATTITAGAAAPATISSTVNTNPGVTVFNFVVNDDPSGTPANQDDGNPTLISAMTITQAATNSATLADWTQSIAGAILTDGTTTLAASAINATSIQFTGINIASLGLVADNGTKTYSLKIWLKTTLGGSLPANIDGKGFGFEILTSGVTASTSGTGLLPAQIQNSGSADVVTVVASKLNFISPASAINASVNVAIPGILIEAVDNNGNRDLDYTGASATVQSVTNGSSQTMSGQPTNGTTQFSAGTLAFNAAFKFTSGANTDDVTLTVKSGANGNGTTCGVNGIICGTSPAITILSSFESRINGDPTFTFSPTINYLNYQAANITPADITNGNGSFELARLVLSDGDADGTAGDQDASATVLNSVTIRIADAANNSMMAGIRSIALYNSGFAGATEIMELTPSPADIAAGQITFSGLTITAPDDNLVASVLTPTPISIRVSFINSAPAITDRTLYRASVVAATVGVGSQFRNSPGDIAGFPGGLTAPLGVNILDVIATKLDFTSQPAAFAGILQPTVFGQVEAHDKFGLLDIDFHNIPASVTSGVSVSGSFIFSSGILNMSTLQYGGSGDGTLNVLAGGLSSNTNNVPAGIVSVPCNHVDVMNVTAFYNTGGAGGVVTSTNLVGGTANKVIFGFSFNAPYTITSPSVQPKVQKFTISFNQPTAGVFFNMKVVESTNGTYSNGLPDVTSIGAAPLTQPTPKDLLVDFTSSPRDLQANPNLTYFLIVDVDPTASGATPAMQVSVVDGGFGTTTNNNITIVGGAPGNLDKASSSASVFGQTYTFASIFPPVLTSSYPDVAQSNVDPAQDKIELTFSVPVFTLDGKATLVDKTNPANTAILTALNGAYASGAGIAAQPIIFSIPSGFMVANHEYYVTIPQGNFTGTGGTGIMDAANNVFGGISYSGTLFFKTANTTPPKLLGTAISKVPAVPSDPVVTDITSTGATLNAIFDKPGTAYFMVLASNSAAPTNAQIKGSVAYVASPVIARGSMPIGSTNPVSQFGTITPLAGTFAPGTHYVWMYAESYSELNHVQTPIPTTAPYGGGPNFLEGTGGPTLSFIAPPVSTSPTISTNLPNISICNNSYQILNAPIIISENANNMFFQPSVGAGTQTFNLVLPAGFQFDVTLNGTTPKYGTLTLVGTDFLGTGSLSFLGNSILTVQFKNNNTASRDKIIISGLRVKATGSSSNSMFRLGGNALPSITDGSAIATLTSFDAATINFDNSYSSGKLGISQPASVVTAIPDDTKPALIQLTPYIDPLSDDFGPSTFTGQGVNINTLTLAAVTLDAPFNITITHTDNNGCISQNPVQYLVYDHNKAVNITKSGVADQGPYCSTNTNFVVNQYTPASPSAIKRDIKYDNLPGYYMEALYANIPASSTTANIINATSFGGAWTSLVRNLPNLVSTTTVEGRPYVTYDFDEVKILNAPSYSSAALPLVTSPLIGTIPAAPAVTAGTLPDPYSFFKSTSGQNQTFYNGGSIGFVEFTGVYRSITNPTVVVPRKQIVEFFVPAVPLVEVGQANQVNAINPGTPGAVYQYCEAGGLITITGYPNALAGTSIGRFTVTDAVSGAVLYDVPPVGASTIPTAIPPRLAGSVFVDNGNGTATLDPAQLPHGYKTMKITYTYQQNNSPCQTTASIVVQVTPNPIARFSFASAFSPNTPVGTAYCENRQINFDATGSTIPAPFSIVKYSWKFAEPNTADPAPGSLPTGWTHTYATPSTYAPSLDVTSNVGCLSVPYNAVPPTFPTVGSFSQSIVVDAIPNVKTKVTGTSIGDTFVFSDNGSTYTGTPTFGWDFDGNNTIDKTGASVTTTYATPGMITYDMTVTSSSGCVNKLSLQPTPDPSLVQPYTNYRKLIILDRVALPAGGVYSTDFEPITGGNGNWQPGGVGTSIGTIYKSALTSSWAYDQTDIATPAEPLIVKQNLWKTGVGSATYNPAEHSALYSPSFDLTKLNRPMISFNAVVQMEKSDGVVLEYSTDNLNVADPNKVWLTLGAIGDGEDWFTDQGIAGRPGTQVANDYGWSGSGNTLWQGPKHVLDVMYPPANPVAPANAVFRWSLGSAVAANGVIQAKGFALDNVRIGDRTRTVLLESFTSASNSDPSEKVENTAIANFNSNGVGTEVVKINYHLGFPAKDPFNEDNAADPSSRALFYNIVKTPRSVMDGHGDPSGNDGLFSSWVPGFYQLRTLQLAQASININAANNLNGSGQPDGGIKIDIDFTSEVLTGLPPNTTLHVAVLEKAVPSGSLSSSQQAMIKSGETNFEFVLKKMLPTAAGTHYSAVIPYHGTPKKESFVYYPEAKRLYAPGGDLAVAVFLQSETAPYEVYQVEILKTVIDPPVVTGIEPIPADQIIVYPNPANKEFTVQFPGALAAPASMQLIDQVGSASLRTTAAEGSTSKTILTEGLASGLYILQIEIAPGVITHKKVMVVHQE
ncbi:MAG TPA: T9SS type A sorting domain-containing protein [Cyclobacteriaceae bacterium]|nr:T9SS type A sorting domain-containing protein [Cyclobacteriaceae bacterium]